MRHKIASRNTALAISFALAMGAPLIAYSDIITLQVPGIPGDAVFAANNGLPPDSIRVVTVGNSVRIPECDPASGGGCADKPIFGPLTVVKQFGESSAPLFLSMVTGAFSQTATITFYRTRAGVATKYYTITLFNVNISSQQWQGNAAGESADAESIEFAFSRIVLRDAATGSRACYDLRRNETC